MVQHPNYRQPMVQHPNYKNQTRDDIQAARCECGGIRYWHATLEGGGCEDCDCPEFTAAGDTAIIRIRFDTDEAQP